jgi:hypothetical protein
MEDRCHLINALDRYRVKTAPVDISEVRKYLKEKFTVGVLRGHSMTDKSAASVDAERFSFIQLSNCLKSASPPLKLKLTILLF